MIIIDPVSPYGAGVFVSSNVPETDYAAYNPATSYALADRVNDNTNHLIYESLAAANMGNALADITKWQLIGSTNRWKMLDALNNTQTTNPDTITLMLSPSIIAQGVYLGGVEGNSVTVTVTDAVEGVVYTETQSMLISTSASSFYNWFFKRIRRKTYFVTAMLPPYANATITITIDNTGGTAKCGMCAVGPLEEVGVSLVGLGTDIKDYSTVRFNSDGTSETTERGYSKRMNIDVLLDNDLIDSIQERLAELRQRSMVWIGDQNKGSTILYGKYSTFKNVIEGITHSKMALQIEGTV